MASMLGKRAAAATVALALVGLAVTAVIGSVHSKLARSPEYASFCNVNESVNCDVVLSSEYADFAGVALPWWAAINYVGALVLALVAWRAERATRRRQAATALFAIALWGFVSSYKRCACCAPACIWCRPD
jgi:uncharacterized membrane protein